MYTCTHADTAPASWLISTNLPEMLSPDEKKPDYPEHNRGENC
jgi:hypothetical protein